MVQCEKTARPRARKNKRAPFREPVRTPTRPYKRTILLCRLARDSGLGYAAWRSLNSKPSCYLLDRGTDLVPSGTIVEATFCRPLPGYHGWRPRAFLARRNSLVHDYLSASHYRPKQTCQDKKLFF